MFIRSVSIRNIRSITELEWRTPDGERKGWNVVLGDNGSGKSTFLRSVSVALLGIFEAAAARQDWSKWLPDHVSKGTISVEIIPESAADVDSHGDAEVSVSLERDPTDARLVRPIFSGSNYEAGTAQGWFSAAFGPFRRFAGGDRENERIFQSNPKLGAHISVFGESVALTEVIVWLQKLRFAQLDSPDCREARLLEELTRFVNQEGFLPHGVKLGQVTAKEIEFKDADGTRVSVEELSDGYRSLLSLTFELIRQVVRAYPNCVSVFDADAHQVIVPGVVMIDEIDAHLHPQWQKKIGFWLTEHFPNFQFIVTTHSPLICQAAVNGSIFLLPAPASQESGRMLTGIEHDRLVYGDILDAYSTEAFGAADTRSHEAHEMQGRLAELNVKELREGLSPAEQDEQEGLRAAFPTAPHTVQPVRSLVEKAAVSNKAAKAFLENLANTAIAEVKKTGMFNVPGLGRLVRVERKARMGRDPATGEQVKIAAKKVVKFRVAKSAKDAIVPPTKN